MHRGETEGESRHVTRGTTIARIGCPDYSQALSAFRRALDLLGAPDRFARSGEPLLIKPNLLAPHPPAAAVTTHPAIVDAALSIASDLGARSVVGDSPGLGTAEKAARAAGILDVCRRHGAPLVDLGRGEIATASGGTYRGLELARSALEAAWFWNLPKWKTHTMLGLTLGVKNLYGCIPGKRKIAAHFRAGKSVDTFAHHLLDLWEALRPALTVLDGVIAMEGPGPSRGRPVARGLLLASADAAALDWEAARLSGLEPTTIPTVRLSVQRRLFNPETIQVVGDPAESIPFRPAPGSACDWPLPGFAKRLLRAALAPVPRFDGRTCTGCRVCSEACPSRALRPGTPPEISPEVCIRCYCCQELCPSGAVWVPSRRLPGATFLFGDRGRRR